MGVKEKIEILRVKRLISVNSHQVVCYCPDKGTDGRLWEEDDILRINIIGKGLSDKLKLCGINKVKDLQNLPNERFSKLIASVISIKMLKSATEKKKMYVWELMTNQ